MDHTYSPDVEIDEDGRIVWAREVKRGENISIPFHMWGQLRRQSRKMSEWPLIAPPRASC